MLVVDDEEVIRELIKSVLTDEGYEVTLAASGRSGVELARSQGFDVALVDLMMPGEMGGFATLRELKGLRPECRVVLMTGRPPDEELESQLRLADAHVLKPFHCKDLVECVRRVAV